MPTTPKPPASIATLLRRYGHPVIAVDPESRTIVGANEAAYELLDRVPPSLDGAPVTEVVSSDDVPAVRASMDLLASKALEGYQAVCSFRN